MSAVDSLRARGLSRCEAQRMMREAKKTMQPPWVFDPRCPRCATLGDCACLDGVPTTVVADWQRIMPLHYFDDEHAAWTAEQVTWDEPPSRWLRVVGAELENRAWWEWHWQRGIYPGTRRAAIPGWMKAAVIARDGLVCQICAEPVEADDVHLDHIKPWSLGGRDTVNNLRVAHSICNMKRGAGRGEDPETWSQNGHGDL